MEQQTEEKKGMHNIKKLFTLGKFQDWIVFFMLCMLLFQAYAYKHDIAICKEYVERDKQQWNQVTNGTGIIQDKQTNYTTPEINLSGLTNPHQTDG